MKDPKLITYNEEKDYYTYPDDGEYKELIDKEKLNSFTKTDPLILTTLIDVSDDVIVNGCYPTNRHTIQRQMQCLNYDGTKLPQNEQFEHFVNIVKSALTKIKVKTLSTPSKRSMDYVFFNEKTKPGFRYEEYFQTQTKEKCRDIAAHVADIRWDNIERTTNESRTVKRKKIIPGF